MLQPPRLINLSLPKTGSTSLAGAFPPGLSTHEGFHEHTVVSILNYLERKSTQADLLHFLRRRQKLLGTPADIATFLHWIPVELLELWPNAKFLHVFRHPCQWACSYLGMLHNISSSLTKRTSLCNISWFERYGRCQSSLLSVANLNQTFSSARETRDLIEDLINFWYERHQTVCLAIPEEKLWHSKLQGLADNLPSLARWIGSDLPIAEQLPRLNQNPSDVRLQRWLLEQACQASQRASVRKAIDHYGQFPACRSPTAVG